MTTVAKYAALTPTTSTPIPHACGVRPWANSRSNHHAAATETVNWNARMNSHYSKGAA